VFHLFFEDVAADQRDDCGGAAGFFTSWL